MGPPIMNFSVESYEVNAVDSSWSLLNVMVFPTSSQARQDLFCLAD